VFGAYVALALWLPKYYVDVYDLDLKVAGPLTALFIFPASFLRPVGGVLSDRLGARRVTFWVFGVIAVVTAILILSMNVWLFTFLIFIVGVAMGIGKASVYKYVPEYYPKDVGATGGLVGAVGGMGGFFLPLLFAGTESFTGRPESTFLVLFVFVFASLIWLNVVVRRILHQASPVEI
jgi:NNP family nitrate/nitrite transporter-like MFS transporter